MQGNGLDGVNTPLTNLYANANSNLGFEDDIFAPLGRHTPDDPFRTARYDLSGPAWDDYLSCRGLTRDGFVAYLRRIIHDAVLNNVRSQLTGGARG